ncbi:unnamed protein product [Meloidogyne enterolobii]|uniref:Uncharacterized protein n=1 Tax=Meloidogyne enterolobii TaxID=390850 RepID=A0ACB0YYE3_MELEN
MLAPYRKVRVRPLLWRQTTLEKYLTTPIFGIVGAIALHYNNWSFFKQENIYDHDGPEKDAKWMPFRKQEIIRHFKIGAYFATAGALFFLLMRISNLNIFYIILKFLGKKFTVIPKNDVMVENFLIDVGFGVPLGGLPVEIAYYLWSIKDEENRKKIVSV